MDMRSRDGMNVNRRDFVCGGIGLAATAVLSRCLAGSGMGMASVRRPEPPLFRMGVMTDTHVGSTRASCGRVKAALDVFRKVGVDLIVNNGDIADHFNPPGYRALRELYTEAFPDTVRRPREIWVYAWHDAYAFHGAPIGEEVKNAPAAFAEVRKCLGAEDPVTTSFVFRGIPMVVVNQFDKEETFHALVDNASRANPGKPLFVFSHEPPAGTVYNSWKWGNGYQAKILERYPMAVVFSGHVHNSLRNDLNIWQDKFTVLNAGCLQHWQGFLPNGQVLDKQSYGVMTVDVFENRLCVRRFDVRSGEEIEPETPWNVELPCPSENAAYSSAMKRARAGVPQYPKGAAASVRADDFGSVTLTFPEVEGKTRAFHHRVDVEKMGEDGIWSYRTSRTVFGDSYLAEAKKDLSVEFDYGFFNPGETVRFVIRPLNAYGVAGRALALEYRIPEPRVGYEVVVDSDWSQDAFPVRNENGRRRLVLPDGAFDGSPQSHFTLVCDIRTELPEDGHYVELQLMDAKTGEARSPWFASPDGDSRTMRYVFSFCHPKNSSSGTCHLQISRGAYDDKVTFSHIKILRHLRGQDDVRSRCLGKERCACAV